jgi:GTP-binding protein Era
VVAGGRKIKQIGTRARHRIERLLGQRVHLELWVKPEPGWAKKPRRLKALGYL